MNLILSLEKLIKELLVSLGYDDEVSLLVSNRPDLGDYQYNGAFKLAKVYHKSPVIIADEIVNMLKDNKEFKSVTNAGGFVNITLSDDALVQYVNEVISDFSINTYKMEKCETVFFDYGGANIAKALHCGHLRSPNIGEAVKRLFNACGYKTISDVHYGDWGRPMGLIICEIYHRYPDLEFFKDLDKYSEESPVSLEDLYEIYPAASAKAKEDESYLEMARNFTLRLQNKEKGIYDLYKAFTKLSINDIRDIYDKLNATFDLYEGESDAEPLISSTVELIKNSGVTSESEGALVIDVKQGDDKKEMPPVLIVKSNGSAGYHTTDLVAIKSRYDRFKPDIYIYFTDIRQDLYFEQLFRAAKKANLVPNNIDLEWYGFGTLNGPDGKPFKTRDGGVMQLRELINIVKDECFKIIKDNIKEEDKSSLAEVLAISAIKYADLLPNRSSDYIFDPAKFSDINGKTGPYLLYSTVRMSSLLKRSNTEFKNYNKLSTKEERDIIINLVNLRGVLERSINSRTVNEICDYIYKLTSSFNAFYSNHEVLSESDDKVKESYLSLIKLVYDTNKYLLDILAITVPDKI